MDTEQVLKEAGQKMGSNINVEGLLRKSGRIKHGAGAEPGDVLGFDYIVQFQNSSYEFYAANPPLIGMTQPVPFTHPVGIEPIDKYKIDYKKVITIFQSGNWGSHFLSISLCKPLVHPQATEPYWYLVSNLHVNVVIGANTGQIISPK